MTKTNKGKFQVHMKGQARGQAVTRSYCVVSAADVEGPAINGAERQKALQKRHKKAVEAVRLHREELAI